MERPGRKAPRFVRASLGPPFTTTLGANVIREYLQRRAERFRTWWLAPITTKDRVLGVVIGGIGCFWVGVLGRIFLGPSPVSGTVIAWWAAGSVTVGVVLGAIFPKAVTCLCFPFSTFGGGVGT